MNPVIQVSSPWRRMQSIPLWPVPSFYNIAEDACDRHPPDKLAMIFDDDRGSVRHIYWRELQELSGRYANTLRGMGVAPGDRIVIVVRQSPEAAAMILAVLRLGAVLLTISELIADNQIIERTVDVDAKVFVTE